MPKKKSVKKAADGFLKNVEDTVGFVEAAQKGLSGSHASRIYDAAVISLYRDFEDLILEVVVAAINNDTGTISKKLGVKFPKHLTDEVCYYLVTGPSYFDFKGRSGLIQRVKQYVPNDHYLVDVLKDNKFKEPLDRLCTLRNYAAHGSPQSKSAVLDAIGQKKIGTAGSWLKTNSRFPAITKKLLVLASELRTRAPY